MKDTDRLKKLVSEEKDELFFRPNTRAEEMEESIEEDAKRMQSLIKSLEGNTTTPAPEKEQVNEEEILKDVQGIVKNISREETNENFYSQAGSLAGMSAVNTVNNMQHGVRGSSPQSGSVLRPDEAFMIAYKRTVESGEPINNIGFYDEINWHMESLGHSKKTPIEIKEFLAGLDLKKE